MASSVMSRVVLEPMIVSLTRSSPKADTVKLRMIAARQVNARFMIGKLKW